VDKEKIDRSIGFPALILEIANEESLATPFPSRAVRDRVLSCRSAKRTNTSSGKPRLFR
jgi:hypothetical protein